MYRVVLKPIIECAYVVAEDNTIVKTFSAVDYGSYANAVAHAKEYWYRHLND